MEEFLAPTALASIFGPVIDQNVIPTTRILRNFPNQGSGFDDSSDSATASLGEEYIFPIKRLQKREGSTSPVSATLPRVKLIRTTLQNAKLDRRNISVASSSNHNGLLDILRRDILSLGCTGEGPLEVFVFVGLVGNARRPLDFSVLRISNKHLSISTSFRTAMIPTLYYAYIFCLLEDLEILRGIGWNRASFDFVWGIISEFSSSLC